MERINPLLKCRISVLLMLWLIPSLALAIFVYEWQDADDPNSTVTGTMIFADNVTFGEIIDPLSDKLLEFSFSNITLSDWSMSDFSSGHFLRPVASGVGLDPSGFAIPTSTTKTVVKKVAIKGQQFSFDRDDAYLYFTTPVTAVKKTVTTGGEVDLNLEPPPLWSWFSSVPPIECPTGTICEESVIEHSGSGNWVLKSSTVPVPEPATFLLSLTGLGVIVSLYRRARRLV